MDDSKNIHELIRRFNVKCEAKGHYYKPNPVQPGFDYCEACGASRATPKSNQIPCDTSIVTH